MKLTPDIIKHIKNVIGEKYFGKLYSMTGFVNDYMLDFWNAQKNLLYKMREMKKTLDENSKLPNIFYQITQLFLD
jgi:hypothetical protein